MQVTDEMIEAAAQSDAEFDKRGWLSMPRTERERYLARARESLTAANAAAWRPIEELDKTDATRVILGIARHGRIEEVHVGSFYWAINEDEVSCWWSDQADDEICPTHWMPRPVPPQQEGE